VKRVVLGSPADLLQCLPNGSPPTGWPRKTNLPADSCQENQSPPALRYAEVCCVKNFPRAYVSHRPQRPQQQSHAFVFGKRRDVFQHDRFGTKDSNEPDKVKYEVIAAVTVAESTIQRGHPGEALARRTTCKQFKLAGSELQFPYDFGHLQLTDVALPDNRPLVIGFVRLDREPFSFHGSNDAESSALQSECQPAATRKKIDRPRLFHEGFWFALCVSSGSCSTSVL
jgi:hypothetical protein